VIGTVLWFVLLGGSLLLELLARLVPSRFSTLSQFGASVASLRTGRVLLILFWIFVGVHLFARYTIPRG
jgi:hypothetical protein